MDEQKKTFGSKFGYIMVAAGAAIGLGNIWKFPYMAYGDGGGIFLVCILAFCVLLGQPLVTAETAVGRFGRCNCIDAYGVINPKWKFVGIVNAICVFCIDIYYVVVSGYVVKYAFVYLVSGDFGADKAAYYNNFISSPIEPLIYTGIIMAIALFMISGGIAEVVEKVTKVIMPLLTLLLIICAVWALFSFDGAVEGLKFYLLPDFSKLTIKTVSDAAVQVMFSVGIGWAIFSTLGATTSDTANLQSDSSWVVICDTAIAFLAGFVVIPSVVGSGSQMVAGPSLVFLAMTDIFGAIPGGRIIGFFFFMALIFAVTSTLLTVLEIPAMCLYEKLKLPRKLGVWLMGLLIFIGAVFCSLSQGDGLLSGVKMPWWAFNTGIVYYNIYDFFDCLSGYVLLPLGCLLTSIYVMKVWGFKDYEKELVKDGKSPKLTKFRKFTLAVCCPVITLLVLLNVFGFIV